MHAGLAREGMRVSEKVVRRLMRERGLRPAYARKRKRWSSYAGEIDDAPPNLPLGKCVLSTSFERKSHRFLSSIRSGSAQFF